MILVVEDDLETRNLLGHYLETQGYEYALAANAMEGRRLLKDKKFKLVITDMHMPGESGLDFMQWVLSMNRKMAGIIMTGRDSATVRYRAREMGAHCCMIKPFHFDQLQAYISDALDDTGGTQARHNPKCI